VNRILLQREKVQISRSFEVLGRRTGIPNGLKQKWKIPEERWGLPILEFGGQGGISILEFPRARGG